LFEVDHNNDDDENGVALCFSMATTQRQKLMAAWVQAEDDLLLEAIRNFQRDHDTAGIDELDWGEIATVLRGRSSEDCVTLGGIILPQSMRFGSFVLLPLRALLYYHQVSILTIGMPAK
jgi:hypothetical protein